MVTAYKSINFRGGTYQWPSLSLQAETAWIWQKWKYKLTLENEWFIVLYAHVVARA